MGFVTKKEDAVCHTCSECGEVKDFRVPAPPLVVLCRHRGLVLHGRPQPRERVLAGVDKVGGGDGDDLHLGPAVLVAALVPQLEGRDPGARLALPLQQVAVGLAAPGVRLEVCEAGFACV